MKGLDTNVLVRFLVQDDPVQGPRASRFIKTQCSKETPCWINRIVLCETVWVLESAYGYRRQAIAEVLEKILHTSQFRLEDVRAAWVALREYRAGKADFADYLLGEVNQQQGCDGTVTFDKQAGRASGFVLLN